MKMMQVPERLTAPVSLRSAWLISRACTPMCASPISPSISARGTSAATESIDDQVHRARAHQLLGDLQRLLAGVGLRDEQLLDAHPELARVGDVERVLGVDEGRDAALRLHLGDGVQGERGLARGLVAEDLHHPAARIAAHAERAVEPDRARWE